MGCSIGKLGHSVTQSLVVRGQPDAGSAGSSAVVPAGLSYDGGDAELLGASELGFGEAQGAFCDVEEGDA